MQHKQKRQENTQADVDDENKMQTLECEPFEFHVHVHERFKIENHFGPVDVEQSRTEYFVNVNQIEFEVVQRHLINEIELLV